MANTTVRLTAVEKIGIADDVFRKVAWRLIPFMILLYFVAFLDRINIGIAALTMNKDLGISATAYGFPPAVSNPGAAVNVRSNSP